MCVELCDSVVSVGQHKRGSNDVKRGLHDDGLHIGQQQHHPKQQEINVISNGLKKENKQEQVYYNNKTKVESITGHQQRGAGSVRKCNKNVTNPMLPASEKKRRKKS
jgi:hypothetical protein